MKFEDYKQYLSPVFYKQTDLVARSARGCYVTDVNGEKYLDFVQGIAVNALGHNDPSVVKAIQDQAANLVNASFNLVNYESTLTLAKNLSEIAPGNLSSIFFSNGGAEATDSALKLAMSYTGRSAVIAFMGSFHGRTVGATSITGSNAKYRKHYNPLMGNVYFSPYPSKDLCPAGMGEEERAEYCLWELERLLKYIVWPEDVACIYMEPIMGEGGYVVPSKTFVQGVSKICKEHGILLIFDEIQCGYGRTGKMWASQHFDVVPDIMTVGKAIAGGLPMSAVISTPEIMEKWPIGTHGTTFGGNPVAAAAGCAVMEAFQDGTLLENVNKMGAYLRGKLEILQSKYACITDVRGIGLMIAIEFSHEDGSPAPDIWATVKANCLKRHMLTLNCGVYGNGMRFATPLNVTEKEIDEGLEILEQSILEMYAEQNR
ncbi:MAG: aspartate aminotransferase family protein [Clostridiales bacterium]|nr:aspartate aminotransferase family protein [Clostridiales bacterium]